MRTYTKRNYADIVAYRYFAQNGEDCDKAPAKIVQLINDYIEMIGNALVDKQVVYFRGWGKLTPRFKKGGRPVRDPKRPHIEMVMHDRWTVTQRIDKENNELSKLHHSEMIKWVENYTEASMHGYNKILMGRCVVEVLVDMLKSLDYEDRIEFRGLGVFSKRLREGRKARNPADGSPVHVEPHYRDKFKPSSVLIRRLNA
ncbi:TPA: HU family DNA-binding protein [Vibrio harveyi]